MRIALLASVLFTAPLFAADAPPAPAPAAPSTKPATTAPTTPIDLATEKDKLKGLIGQEASVRGKVVDVFVPRSGSVTILNFFPAAQRRDFNAVIDKANLDSVNAAFNGDVAAAVKDQTVLITGTVSEYRGNPQIKIEKPEQLKIEPAKEEKPAEKAPEKPAN
jgi:DNA/RNA endonuclease YhcR with UshA esterase domain